MDSIKFVCRAISTLSAVLLSIAVISCALTQPSVRSADAETPTDSSALKMQALVMDMADDYIAELGESVYLITRSGKLDSKGRWLAQSFLRNGVGAALDIAVSPNPSVSLLDLLVLTSLQTWSFETHWVPAGIGEAGIPALDRLRRAEMDAWTSAKEVISEDQRLTLRELIKAWISENPDRTVVALVRFNEFAEGRKISSLSLRGKAQGLLKEVSEASVAVDEARLLGERLLWFAGRYPYLLGEQTELTAYRLIDQPEGAQLIEAIKSVQRLSEAMTKSIGKIQSDLEDQQSAFFANISDERKAAIAQLQIALAATVKKTLDRASESINTQRTKAINQLFEGLAQERTLFLDDLASRQTELIGVITELHQTITDSGALAKELTEMMDAVDRVVSRFDTEPAKDREPLRMSHVRDAAIETGRAADQLTRMLERAIELIESKDWDHRISIITDPAESIVDQAFWRGVILIVLLIVGFGLLRLVPQRNIDKQIANPNK